MTNFTKKTSTNISILLVTQVVRPQLPGAMSLWAPGRAFHPKAIYFRNATCYPSRIILQQWSTIASFSPRKVYCKVHTQQMEGPRDHHQPRAHVSIPLSRGMGIWGRAGQLSQPPIVHCGAYCHKWSPIHACSQSGLNNQVSLRVNMTTPTGTLPTHPWSSQQHPYHWRQGWGGRRRRREAGGGSIAPIDDHYLQHCTPSISFCTFEECPIFHPLSSPWRISNTLTLVRILVGRGRGSTEGGGEGGRVGGGLGRAQSP